MRVQKVLTKKAKPESCEMCERNKLLSFHHLIPRKNHRRNAFKRRFDKADMLTRGLWLCHACHRKLHRTFDEKELGMTLNTLKAILAQPEIQTYLRWVRKQA